MIKWNRKGFHIRLFSRLIIEIDLGSFSVFRSRFFLPGFSHCKKELHSSRAAGLISKSSFVNDLKPSLSKLIFKMKVILQINPKLIVK